VDLDPADGLIAGSVGNADWFSVLAAGRAAATPATNFAGAYTLLLPPGDGAPTNSPGGYGFATLTNSADGNVVLAGCLGDGEAIGQSVPLLQHGKIPVYVSLYTGRGSLMGWAAFSNPLPKTVSGVLNWIKPPTAVNTLYPQGFTNAAHILGSEYAPPRAGAPALNLPDATLTLAGGDLAGGPLVFTVGLASNNIITNLTGAPTNHLAVSIVPSTGAMTLTFRPTGAAADIVAQGAVLQNQTNAAGWFFGANQTGSFLLTPR
jgi:hypothetical protein